VKVNWAQFAADREKYRESVRAKKSRNKQVERRVSMGTDKEEERKPIVLGKRRCVGLPEKDVPTVSSLILTPKLEAGEGCVMAGRQGFEGKGRGKSKAFMGPSWLGADLQDMQSVLEWNTKLVLESKRELADSCREKEKFEGELRRAKMMHSDRQVMLLQSKHDFEKCAADESYVKGQIERNVKLLAELQQNPSLVYGNEITEISAALQVDRGRIDTLSFKKSVEERTVRLSTEVVADCESTISQIERQLQTCNATHSIISTRVASVESLLNSMDTQLQEMREGRGSVFYPRPISSNPTTAVESICVLNACPVCSLWYSCKNFVSADCGHTYHLWCLAEHCKKSQKCMVSTCNTSFSSDRVAATGVRPSLPVTAAMVKKELLAPDLITQHVLETTTVGKSVSV
jgi:hypothetical protein